MVLGYDRLTRQYEPRNKEARKVRKGLALFRQHVPELQSNQNGMAQLNQGSKLILLTRQMVTFIKNQESKQITLICDMNQSGVVSSYSNCLNIIYSPPSKPIGVSKYSLKTPFHCPIRSIVGT
ncbi:MAG: hypothetical protein Ct9H300mP21_07910 [Pseudomonadota bacterium]|nr:MAG: hypothetical protein Ct9H300mP21_07910 [Pseudomonadota bacterium]